MEKKLIQVLGQEMEVEVEQDRDFLRFTNPALPQTKLARTFTDSEPLMANTFKMKPELKALWLTALADETFKQCSGALCKLTDDGRCYCCLGIYCIAREVAENGYRNNGISDIQVKFVDEAGGTSNLFLPSQLEEELPRPIQEVFAAFNDGGFTFAEIRQIVEVCL